MDDRARVSLSVHEGKLELEGSEAFVEKQLERLGDVINALLAGPAKRQDPGKPIDQKASSDELPAGSLDSYPNLFAVADDRIQILKTLPGSNKAEKTVSAALLYLLASELRGTKTVLFETIRETCKAHACLDETNFASTMKQQKAHFVCGGSGKKQTATLTVPGRKRAEALATELNTA